MSRRRAVKSESRQEQPQAVQKSQTGQSPQPVSHETRYRDHRKDHYKNHYVVLRSRSPQTSPSSLQLFSSAAWARRFIQLKSGSTQVSRSICRHPYWWLGATWLLVIGVGSVAAVVMLKINPAEPPAIVAAASETASSPTSNQLPQNAAFQERQTEPLPEAGLSQARSTPALSKPKASLPLFALGTVALSCAVGCLWLSYRFKSPPRPTPRFPARPHRLPRPAVAVQPATVSISNPSSRSTLAATQASDPIKATPVAIVSSTEDHPLDWQEPSLADNLDIRQQRPLSHWL